MQSNAIPRFDKHVCVGDTIEWTEGRFRFIATVYRDEDYKIDDDDSHCIDREVTGCNDEQQAKLLAARKAWHDDEWFYCGVGVVAYIDSEPLNYAYDYAIWGVACNYPESDNSYLSDLSHEISKTIVREAARLLDSKVDELCKRRDDAVQLIESVLEIRSTIQSMANDANYEIHFADGSERLYPFTTFAAMHMLKEKFGDGVCFGEWDTYGSDGDMARMLVWKNEEEADRDQVGAKAVAEIIRR